MNNITLITSEGCLGCEVMRTSIEIEEMDINKVNKNFIKQFHIYDTPCALFFKDDKYLFKKIGSVPTVVVVQWINVHYK